MIEKVKTTPSMISLYDLISTSKKHKEILYALFKNKTFPTNITGTIFLKNLSSIKECDRITFYRSEKLSKETLTECVALYITPMIEGWKIKRTMVDNGSVVNICSHKFFI